MTALAKYHSKKTYLMSEFLTCVISLFKLSKSSSPSKVCFCFEVSLNWVTAELLFSCVRYPSLPQITSYGCSSAVQESFDGFLELSLDLTTFGVNIGVGLSRADPLELIFVSANPDAYLGSSVPSFLRRLLFTISRST